LIAVTVAIDKIESFLRRSTGIGKDLN
jgi:hypothetical protein